MSSRVNIFVATKQFLLKTDMSTVSQRTEILSWEIRALLPAEQNRRPEQVTKNPQPTARRRLLALEVAKRKFLVCSVRRQYDMPYY